MNTRTRPRPRALAIAPFVLICAGLLLFAAPQAAHGQTGDFAFNISPLLVELNAAPGGVAHFDIQVINQSRTNSATFEVRIASVREKPDGSFEFSYDPDLPYSAASWITMSTDRFTVGPSGGQTIFGEVTVPRNAHGGRYAAVLLELQPEEKTDAEANAATVFRYRMASIIELTIGNRFDRLAHISALEVLTGEEIPALGRQFGPDALLIYASLTNESDVHVSGRGTLHIRDQNGRKVREIPLGTGRGVVLPGGTLNFSSILPGGLPAGTYTLQAVLSYGGLRPAIASREFSIEPDAVLTGQFVGGPAVRFNVVPGEIDLELPAGARRLESITLENHDSVPILIRGEAQPLIYDDYGELDVIAMEDAAGQVTWVDINPAEVVLQPGQRRNVRVVVNAGPEYEGGRYAHLEFDASEIDPKTREEVAGGLHGQLGATIALTSLEGHVLDAEVEELRIVPPAEGAPLGIEVHLVNTGNVHFQGSGTMTLARYVVPESVEGVEFIGTGSFETVWSGPLPADILQKVLPGERRLITGSVSQPLEPGLYRVTVEVNQGSRPLASAQAEFEIASPEAPGAPVAETSQE